MPYSMHAAAVVMQMFKSRVGSMRKGLKSRAHFLFQDAPFHVSSKCLSSAAKMMYQQDGAAEYF
jgi:hypothetical protein